MASHTISKLIIYPVKGLKGIEVEEAIFEESGLQYDRRWMIIDSQSNRFISQRTHAIIALFECEIKGNRLKISYEGDSISLDLDLVNESELLDVTVWDDTVPAYEVDKTVSFWLSQKLAFDCKLVKIFDDQSRRKYYDNDQEKFTHVSFADGYPALIVGTSSLDELNKRCPVPIHYSRFRPNIVVNTDIPHEEDTWTTISTNQVAMQIIKPCIRCKVINIDQFTAESSVEPTKTLVQYRMSDEGILFGVNIICLTSGLIKRGDKLLVV